VVDPAAGERFPGRRLGLRDLALVVREDQVLAATVDVERRAEIFHRHRRALDVPAGTPFAPRSGPRRLARLGRLPEREVARIALALVDLDTGPGEQLVEVLPGQTTVGRKSRDLEIDVTVDDVGDAGADELLDEPDHLADVVGRLRLDVAAQDADGIHVAVGLGDVAFRDVAGAHAFGVGALDDSVVDVGEVLDERHAIPLVGEVPANDVEDDGAPRVPDVAEVVHRDPAHVHPHLARHGWNEILLLAREGVVDAEAHVTSTPTTAMAAMPSLRPSRPRPSGLFAFTLTASRPTPSVSASRFAISSRWGCRRGTWASTVASTLTRRPPRER